MALSAEERSSVGRRAVWPIAGAGFLVFLAVLGVFGYCTYWAPSLTEAELRREISAQLPPGSTRKQIFAFLMDRGAAYNQVPERAEEHFYLTHDVAVPPETPVIVGLIRNTGKALFGSVHLEVYFLLNADGTLDRFFVEDVVTGL